MQEEFSFGGEVVIDDIVQQGDVYTTSCNIGDKEHHGFSVHKLPNVDLSGSLIQGAVDVGTLYALWRQELQKASEFLVNCTKNFFFLRLEYLDRVLNHLKWKFFKE